MILHSSHSWVFQEYQVERSLPRLEAQSCRGHSRIRAAPAQMGLKQTTNGPERWVQNITEHYSLVTAVLTASSLCLAWAGSSEESLTGGKWEQPQACPCTGVKYIPSHPTLPLCYLFSLSILTSGEYISLLCLFSSFETTSSPQMLPHLPFGSIFHVQCVNDVTDGPSHHALAFTHQSCKKIPIKIT